MRKNTSGLWANVCLLGILLLTSFEHSHAADVKETYADSDVVVLNPSNINQIHNSNETWIVNFYASWCGHCRRFAPSYKNFASGIKDWAPRARVGAINCNQYGKTCSNYSISGYPTIRTFGTKLNATKKGVACEGRDPHELRYCVVQDIFEGDIPFMEEGFEKSYSDPSINKQITGNSTYLMVIFDQTTDLVFMKNALMDTYKRNDILVVRASNKTGEQYNLTKYPIILTFKRGDGKEPDRSPDQLTRETFKAYIDLLGKKVQDKEHIKEDDELKKGVEIGDKNDDNQEKRYRQDSKEIYVGGEKAKEQLEDTRNKNQENVEKNGDSKAKSSEQPVTNVAGGNIGSGLDNEGEKRRKAKEKMPVTPVHLQDLITVLHRIFRTEVSTLHAVIEGKKLKVICAFIGALQNSFPDESVRQSLSILYTKINQINIRSIIKVIAILLHLANNMEWGYRNGKLTRDQWQALIDTWIMNEFGTNMPMNSDNQPIERWVSCNTAAYYDQGYTCGLWILMHTMTTGCDVNDKQWCGGSQLLIIRDFIEEYLTCTECRKHFVAMVDKQDSAVVRKWPKRKVAMLLWMAHNIVNNRLKAEDNITTTATKIQFPPFEVCPQCHNTDPTAKQYYGVAWNEDQVHSYLVEHYVDKIVVDYSPKEKYIDQSHAVHQSRVLLMGGLCLVGLVLGRSTILRRRLAISKNFSMLRSAKQQV